MRKIIWAASAALFVACATLGPRYYLTVTPRSVHSRWSDSVRVHLDEKTAIELDARLLLGRKEHLEQAACLRINHRSPDQREFWVDSVLQAYVMTGTATDVSIRFSCDAGTAPWHAHVLEDSYRCYPSDSTRDQGKGWSVYPVLLLSCGIGPDSMVAWRVRP